MAKTVDQLLTSLRARPYGAPGGYAYAIHSEVTYSITSRCFSVRDGDMGYGSEVFEKKTGCVEIRMPEGAMRILLSEVVQNGQATIRIETSIKDRLGSPGWPEYQAYENNVKQYIDAAIINVAMDGDDLLFAYDSRTIKNTRGQGGRALW